MTVKVTIGDRLALTNVGERGGEGRRMEGLTNEVLLLIDMVGVETEYARVDGIPRRGTEDDRC